MGFNQQRMGFRVGLGLTAVGQKLYGEGVPRLSMQDDGRGNGI